MPAGATYEPLATTTLGTAQSTITFSSISGSYTDLRLVLTGAANTTGIFWGLQFNSDTATNYSYTLIQGNGSTASSARSTNGTFTLANYNSITSISNAVCDIMNYAGSTFKTVLMSYSGDANGSGTVQRSVGLYRSTSAITSITVTTTSSDKFGVGTTATLYGIKNSA